MTNLRFGIVTDFYGIQMPLPKALRCLSRRGFSDVEIPGRHLFEDALIPDGAPKVLKKLRAINKLTKDLGITIWQIHGPGNDLAAESQNTRNNNIDVFKKWLECCQEIDCRCLVIHLGTNGFGDSKEINRIKKRSLDSLFKLSEYMKGEKVKLALENYLCKHLDSPGDTKTYGFPISGLKDLISQLKSENIGLCLDTGHANIEGIDIPSFINEMRSFLIATHIQENNGINDMHMFPFSLRRIFSKMDWFAIFRAFQKINYPYPLVGECANSLGELPFWLKDDYLKSQKGLLDKVLLSSMSQSSDSK